MCDKTKETILRVNKFLGFNTGPDRLKTLVAGVGHNYCGGNQSQSVGTWSGMLQVQRRRSFSDEQQAAKDYSFRFCSIAKRAPEKH